MTTHWHHVLVEHKDDGDGVLLGAYLSSGRLDTKEQAADEVSRLLVELTQLDEAAIRSAREDLISKDEAVQLTRWANAARELRLKQCDDCAVAIRGFRDQLAASESRRTGRPVSFLPPPAIS